jgi:glycosyltransferase involved in cell wall biosynthesis
MKFCIVAYKFGTEQEIGEHLGTYHYFIEKMRILVRHGHEVFVVAPRLSFLRRGSDNVDGVKVIRYYPPFYNRPKFLVINSLLRLWYIQATQKKVLKLDGQIDLDVIYVWQARGTGYAIAKIKNKLRAPFIFRQITAWQWHFEREIKEIFGERKWYLWLRRAGFSPFVDRILEFLLDRKSQINYAKTIYKTADRVVFVSHAAAREGLALGLSPQKVAVIGVGIDIDAFRPLGQAEELRRELGISGRKVVMFIGRINFAEKGIGYLLEAMPEVIAKFPDVVLAIIGGGGEMAKLLQKVADLGIGDHVQLVGRKPFFELPKYLNAADVLVVPSVWLEHFGQVTIDAMACGIPVVTSDSGGSTEINIDKETGLVVPAKNSERLSQAVMTILSDEELKKRMGQRARQRVLQNFTYEVLVDKFINLVKNVQK